MKAAKIPLLRVPVRRSYKQEELKRMISAPGPEESQNVHKSSSKPSVQPYHEPPPSTQIGEASDMVVKVLSSRKRETKLNSGDTEGPEHSVAKDGAQRETMHQEKRKITPGKIIDMKTGMDELSEDESKWMPKKE